MSRTGRPREFDRDDAVQQAMTLFWARGYEGATLADLQAAMGGITAPSFYAAFGSKEALFREAVELYNETQGAPVAQALTEGATARAAIECMLQATVDLVCRPGHPRGCLMVLGAINCMPAHKSVEDFMRAQREIRDQCIRARLRQGVADGDIASGTDINALAAFYASAIEGLAIRSRDGASRKTLKAIADRAMMAWDSSASARAQRGRGVGSRGTIGG